MTGGGAGTRGGSARRRGIWLALAAVAAGGAGWVCHRLVLPTDDPPRVDDESLSPAASPAARAPVPAPRAAPPPAPAPEGTQPTPSFDAPAADRLLTDILSRIRAREQIDPREAISELARRIHADSAVPWAIERLLAADADGDFDASAVLVAAIGQVPDSAAILAALDVYPRLSQSTRGLLVYAAAQDRGRATPDPYGRLHFGQHAQMTEIVEPEVRRRIVALAPVGPDGRLRRSDVISGLINVLALSAHLDPVIEGLLIQTSKGTGNLARSAGLAYLTSARGDRVVDFALEVIRSDSADAATEAEALSALARMPGGVEKLVTALAPELAASASARRVRACGLLSRVAEPGRMNDTRAELVVVELRRLASDSEPDVRSAAVAAIGNVAFHSGGWSRRGLDPSQFIRSSQLSEAARAAVARSWGRCHAAFGDHEAAFRETLFDPEIPDGIRVEGWKGLGIDAVNAASRSRIAALVSGVDVDAEHPWVVATIQELAARLRE